MRVTLRSFAILAAAFTAAAVTADPLAGIAVLVMTAVLILAISGPGGLSKLLSVSPRPQAAREKPVNGEPRR
jgi:hypothetical protein